MSRLDTGCGERWRERTGEMQRGKPGGCGRDIRLRKRKRHGSKKGKR
jgi:hypothetical protein